MKQATIKLIFLLLCPLVLLPRPAMSHRLIIFPSFQHNAIHIETYFPGGDKARQAKVLVRDHNGKVVAKGITDDKGTFSFTPSAPGTYDIFVDAGLGHGAKTSITVGENESAIKGQKTEGQKKTRESGHSSTDMGDVSHACMTRDEMKGLLAPLVSEIELLRRSQERVRIRDVIGGIGYVLGIFGIIAIIRKDTRKG